MIQSRLFGCLRLKLTGLPNVVRRRFLSAGSTAIVSLTLHEVLAKLNRGDLSAVDVTKACLQHIEAQRRLNAFISVTADMALQQARESDNRRKQGKRIGRLDGVPVAVKDNFSTEGVLTSCGSKMLEEYIPPFTATVVQRLLDEGAILIGKTNMDEFAMGSASTNSYYGPVLNPWNKIIADSEFVAGGSSGGSACAVAAHLCFGALGSDTGGSVRYPASLCGVVGFMPCYGRTSRHGLIPLASSLDCPALFARSVKDAGLLADVISGHDPLDSTSAKRPPLHVSRNLQETRDLTKPLEGVRIGIPREYYIEEILPEYEDMWRQAADWAVDAGAEVFEVSLPHTWMGLPCYYAIANAETASNLAKYDGLRYGHRAAGVDHSTDALYGESRAEGFQLIARNRIRSGTLFLSERMYGEYYTMAAKARRLIAQDFYTVLGNEVEVADTKPCSHTSSRLADVLLYPTTAGPALTFNEYDHGLTPEAIASDIYSCPVNLAGLPAITVPVGFAKNSMPLGLQVVGPRFGELAITQVAQVIENRANFPKLTSEAKQFVNNSCNNSEENSKRNRQG